MNHKIWSKIIGCTIFLIVLQSCTCIIPLSGERVRYYNDKGSYTGYSVETGYSIRYYSPSGKFLGKGVK